MLRSLERRVRRLKETAARKADTPLTVMILPHNYRDTLEPYTGEVVIVLSDLEYKAYRKVEELSEHKLLI
jgi:hypothetical protein